MPDINDLTDKELAAAIGQTEQQLGLLQSLQAQRVRTADLTGKLASFDQTAIDAVVAAAVDAGKKVQAEEALQANDRSI